MEASIEGLAALKGIRCDPIPRRQLPANDQEVLTMLKDEVPVVITNSKLCDSAVKTWDLQFLSDYCGDENLFSVRASSSGSSAFIYADSAKNEGSFDWRYPIASVDMPFSSYAAILAAKAAAEGREVFQVRLGPGHTTSLLPSPAVLSSL
jgi:hypothetical protein